MQTFENDSAAGDVALRHAVAAVRAGMSNLAASQLERAAELNPDNPDVWLWLAWSADSPDNMIRRLERALELSPANETAKAGLIWARMLCGELQSAVTSQRTSCVVKAVDVPAEVTRSVEPVETVPTWDSWNDRSQTMTVAPDIAIDETAHEQFQMPVPVASLPADEPVVEIAPISNVNPMNEVATVDDWAPTDTEPVVEPALEIEAQRLPIEPVVVATSDQDVTALQDDEPEPPRRRWSDALVRSEIEAPVPETSVPASVPPPLPPEALVSPAVSLSAVNSIVATPTIERPSLAFESMNSESDSVADVEALSESLSLKTSSQDHSSDGRPLVMVVDDSPTVRKLVSLTLERRGYRVISAFDGVAAIKELGSCRPDLILLDINMPRLDGYRLCKLIKKHEATQTIPVVMLSGKDGMFDKLRGRLVGCSDYITKPFEADALSHKVAKYLTSVTTSSL